MNDLQRYLEPTYTIDSTNPEIESLVHKITGDLQDVHEKAVKLFVYVRDNISYNMYEYSDDKDRLKASYVLHNKKGWCVQKAILLAALGRAAGIPSRLVIASIKNHRVPREVWDLIGTNIFFPHAYNEFYLDNGWKKAAATFDRKLCERIRVPVVEFDGCHDATLPEKDLDGNLYIEYIEKFGYYHDYLPEMFATGINELYGQISDKQAF